MGWGSTGLAGDIVSKQRMPRCSDIRKHFSNIDIYELPEEVVQPEYSFSPFGGEDMENV